MLNSLSFCLSVKLLISPSYLNEILAGYSNLGCRFFSFMTLSMSCHSFLAWRVSVERSAVILMGILLCVICCFPLAAFNICFLCYLWFSLLYKNIKKYLLIYLTPPDLSCCTWDLFYVIQDLFLQNTESLVVTCRLDGRDAWASDHVGSGIVAPT